MKNSCWDSKEDILAGAEAVAKGLSTVEQEVAVLVDEFEFSLGDLMDAYRYKWIGYDTYIMAIDTVLWRIYNES